MNLYVLKNLEMPSADPHSRLLIRFAVHVTEHFSWSLRSRSEQVGQ